MLMLFDIDPRHLNSPHLDHGRFQLVDLGTGRIFPDMRPLLVNQGDGATCASAT